METNRFRVHQTLSSLACLMSRNREYKPGHPVNFYPRQDSAGNTEWKGLAQRVSFLVLFYSPRLALFEAHRFQVASQVDAHFLWTPSASKGAPNVQTSVGVSGLMGFEGRTSLGHFASLWDKGTGEVCTDFNSLFL